MKQVTFKEAMSVWNTPERLVLVTSIDPEGKPHVMTAGWKMRTSFKPPMIAIAVGKERYMHKCISESNEFVIAVPGANLAKEVLTCGSPQDKDVDRMELCQFSKKPGNFIKAPLIQKCSASFECKLVGQLDTGDHTIFVGQVLASWIHEEPKQNLLLVGDESGYEFLAEGGPYKIGVIKN